MLSLTKMLVAAGLLCAATQAVEMHQDFYKEYPEPVLDSTTILYPSNESLLYMYCIEKGFEGVDCSLKLKMVNGTEKNCDVKFPVSKKDYEFYIFDVPQLKTMLGGNKAVFQWNIDYYFKSKNEFHKYITLVDMNNCSPVLLDYPNDVSEDNLHLLAYEDSFHVYLRSKVICGEQFKSCILRYNHEGRQIDESVVPLPSDYLMFDRSMVVDRLNQNSGAYFIDLKLIDFKSSLMIIRHVNADGSDPVIIRGQLVNTNIRPLMSAVQSNENGYFSLCYPNALGSWEETHCIQSDVNGQKKGNMAVTLEKEHTVVAVFNQRRGGLLIVNINCSTPIYNCTGVLSEVFCLSSFSRCNNAQVRVKEVAMNGEVIGDTELTGLRLDGHELTINHLETNTEHCFYFAYVEYRFKSDDEISVYKYIKKCLKKTVQ